MPTPIPIIAATWPVKSGVVTNAAQIVTPVRDTRMPQMAVAWVLRNQNVASAIVGASRPEQLEATVSAVDLTVDDPNDRVRVS